MTGTAFAAEPADTVAFNGKIYMVNHEQPWAEAIAIRGTDIVDAEGFISSLEVGKRADLIVLDQNPFDLTAQEFADINVLATSRKSSNFASNSEFALQVDAHLRLCYNTREEHTPARSYIHFSASTITKRRCTQCWKHTSLPQMALRDHAIALERAWCRWVL